MFYAFFFFFSVSNSSHAEILYPESRSPLDNELSCTTESGHGHVGISGFPSTSGDKLTNSEILLARTPFYSSFHSCHLASCWEY